MSGAEQFTDSGESGERLAGAGERFADAGERPADAGERLERAYGRLLRWYPAGHQARHGDEMLGVLMAGAGSGRRRPGLADSANLIGGALRIRLRAATTGSAGRWRAALAQAGILLPLAWAAGMLVVFSVFVRNWTAPGVSGYLNASLLANSAQVYLPPIVVLITMLLGWRPLALAAIAAAVITGPGDTELRHLIAPQPYDATFLAVMVVAALAVIAGSRRARALLTWKHYVLAIAVAVAVAGGRAAQQLASVWPAASVRHPGPAGWPAAELADLAVVAAITVLLLVRSAASRRLLVISAVPLYFYVVVIVTPVYRSADLLIDLPLVALAGAAVLLAAARARACARARAWRRRAAPGGNA